MCVVACGNQAASEVVLSSTIPHPFEAGSLIGLVLSKRLDCLASVPQGSIGLSTSPVLGLQHTWNIYVGSKDRPLVLMFCKVNFLENKIFIFSPLLNSCIHASLV